MNKLRVLELFAGIGACSKALENLGIPHEIVDAVEIDKYAVKSFNAIHGTNFEPQDITKWDKDIKVDLIMHGSPCTNFSIAGKQAGGDKGSGTPSSLMYETLRIVKRLKPKYVIWENVKNLLSKRHIHNFNSYLDIMKKLGYTNYHQVLNAKDYGIPQNRERVFTVSILGDEEYKFPPKQKLELRLKDILEDEVDEKYYLSDKQLNGMVKTKFNQYNVKSLLKDDDSCANCLKARFEGNPQLVSTGPSELARKVYNEAVRKGLVKPNDVIEHTYSNARLSEIGKGYIKTQNSKDNQCMSTLKTNPQKLGVCVCVASRGRNPDNPSSRVAGLPTKQHLEPRMDGNTNTITSVQKDNYVAIRTANKQGYDLAEDGDGIDLAYPKSKTRRGRVGHGVSKTLACSDTMGTLDGYRIRKLTPKDSMWYNGVYEERYKESREILQILQQKIGEETFCEWAIRGLWCILSESVLFERVYAKSIFENWCERPELVKFAYFGKNNQPIIPTQEQVRNMWVNWQDRYPSYRRELSEQQFRQLKSVVQKLPHQVASLQGFVQGLWETYEGTGLLRQALSEIQKIWESDARWEVQWPDYRIRKLTPLSCWRLMGFDDSDFEKAEKVNSNTQLYKQAGNSIVVNVLEAILKGLLKDDIGVIDE